jgi:molecular chaperone GrpE
MHSYSPDVTEPTAVQILQPGYGIGERVLRPARVAVAEPGGEAEPEPAPEASAAEPDQAEADAAQPQAEATDED